jgi:hypothetical protein
MITHFSSGLAWVNSYPQTGQTLLWESTSIAQEGHSFFDTALGSDFPKVNEFHDNAFSLHAGTCADIFFYLVT